MRRTPVTRARRGPARALAPVAVLALVSALAAGCGGDADSDADDDAPEDKDQPVVALTEEQIAEALLQETNLGEGWTAEPLGDEENDPPGCLADVDTLTEGLTKTARAGTEFTYGESGVPDVESTVTAYDDEVGVSAVFDQVKDVLSACTTIDDTDSRGTAWNLTLATSTDTAYDDVDAQFDLSATGTFTEAGGEPVEIYIEWTSVRVGPNVGAITTIDLEPRSAEHDVWAEIAVERLVDVAEGDEPEATTAPAPA